MQLDYRVTCPIDNLTLYPVVLDPESAPWFCAGCRHSWWATELSEDARKLFRKGVEDFGWGDPTWALQRVVLAERDVARERGTSARGDMLELIPLAGLQRMVNDPRIDKDFIPIVMVEMTRKNA